ncbi:MAG: nuclear transport factor 2 family protein [Oleiphilaceae bacterium]|nr:nuclear transport factor 2 family protein [Oleiphilaceae bacterium]
MSEAPRHPLPPFSYDDAVAKVRKAENAWNGKNPEVVSLAYTPDSVWRNRSEFLHGRADIVAFLTRKWHKEHDYRLIKDIWAHGDDRIAVRFAYEWHDANGQWYRSYGNENWEFDALGYMQTRHASINDVPIDESERKFRWEGDERPSDYPGLSELGL